VVNRLPDDRTDTGCRSDEQTSLDASGNYTYVIGTEAQRSAIERIPGVTFLPFSTGHPHALHVILLRNMLLAPGFRQSVQNVPEGGSPEAAEAAMGSYYPKDAICSLAILQANGPDACLPTS
jgi:hypothetical protein